MKYAHKLIKNFFTYLLWGLGSPFFLLFLVPLSYLPASRRYDSRLYHFIARLWARYLVYAALVRFSVRGGEYVPQYPEQPALILVNHASVFDIPLAEILFKGYPHIWISNDYSRIPFFGTLLTRMHLVVDRSDVGKMVGVLKKAHALVKDKPRHLFMFPEGMRYSDGQIHDFFGGFALLAEKMQRPVIPVVLCGLNKIFPKGRLMIDSSDSPVKISIGKPINHSDYASRQDFINAVQGWFKQELELLKKA